MDSPQYRKSGALVGYEGFGFKPYYKWIVLNTRVRFFSLCYDAIVLNLIINGQSSIPFQEKEKLELQLSKF